MGTHRKTLYLIRHAKSSWDDASLSDRDRPLNKRGQKNAPDMGQRMADQGHKPDHIISSPANRALTTARIIAGELGIEEHEIEINRDLYFTGTGGMIAAIESADDRHDSLMLTGHNPTMTDLLNGLSGAGVYNMPTCAVAIIGFDMESWGLVQSTDGELLGYDFPKGSGSFTGRTG